MKKELLHCHAKEWSHAVIAGSREAQIVLHNCLHLVEKPL